MMWSQKFEQCVNCGKTEKKHIARGLCLRCYEKDLNEKHKGQRKWAAKSKILTRDYLFEEYLKKRRSLSDIAEERGCLAENVYAEIVRHLAITSEMKMALNEELKSLESIKVRKDTNRKKKAGHLLTKEYLHTEYTINKRSLGEIAKECGCSRTFVHRRLEFYGIPLRDKTTARTLALTNGKLIFARTDEDGQTRSVTLQKNIYKDDFFSKWSDKMAYVLGVICTDGNLRPRMDNDPLKKYKVSTSRFTVYQKEPELLKKVLSLMECNAKLLYRKKAVYKSVVAGEGYFFHVNNEKIYNDLISLGLTPNKSLTLKFPKIPPPYVRHFIRGCWDGDGSFHYETKSGRFGASFVSGSLQFIEGMLAELYKAGLPKRTIHKHTHSSVYYFKYTHGQCIKLYHYLYDSVPESQYLTRKHDLIEEFVLGKGRSKLTPKKKEIKWRDIYEKYYAKKEVKHED